MPGALVLAPFSAGHLDRLRGKIDVTYESWLDTHWIQDPEELGARLAAECISVLVIEADFVFEEVFEAAESLRLVGVCRGSADHVDLETATRHGVVVVNSPGRNAQSVAEHVLALMLSLARGIPSAHAYVKRGQWENPAEPYVSMRGVELSGRKLGIVGLGAIGRRLTMIGLALGMGVAAHDPYVSDAPSCVSLMDLDDLLAWADFVSLHLPATEKTAGLLNRRSLSLMKSTAYLVNTSDASIIDRQALISTLKTGGIAGAGLDVFGSHPVAPSDPLLALDNIVLTPHLAGATEETVERHSRMIADDVLRFLGGERPKNLVNPEVWNRRA